MAQPSLRLSLELQQITERGVCPDCCGARCEACAHTGTLEAYDAHNGRPTPEERDAANVAELMHAAELALPCIADVCTPEAVAVRARIVRALGQLGVQVDPGGPDAA